MVAEFGSERGVPFLGHCWPQWGRFYITGMLNIFSVLLKQLIFNCL